LPDFTDGRIERRRQNFAGCTLALSNIARVKFAGESHGGGKERLREFYKTVSDNLSRICTVRRYAKKIREWNV